MRDCMTDRVIGKIFLKLENVWSERLYVAMLCFADVPNQQMHRHLILREVRGHLYAHKRVMEISDLQATVDPIVVGQGDIGHPFLFQPSIEVLWTRVAVRKLESTKDPFSGSIAEFGMNMKIDFFSHEELQGIIP